MANPDQVASIKTELIALFQAALQAAFPSVTAQAEVVQTNQPKFGDYQCNNAMALFGKLKGQVCPGTVLKALGLGGPLLLEPRQQAHKPWPSLNLQTVHPPFLI